MDFKVGPYTYHATMARGYLDLDGQRCLGLCDHEQHVLEVSDQCSSAQRVQVICHEYMEAWLYHFGHAEMDKEAYCDLFGLAMTQFAMDHLPRWCNESPPLPAPRQARPGFYSDRRSQRAALDAEVQRPKVTSVRVTDHFMPAAPGQCSTAGSSQTHGVNGGVVASIAPEVSVGDAYGGDPFGAGGAGGTGGTGGTRGWRVRVMEPVIEPA